MMKEVRMTIGWVIGTLVFLLTGCDQGEKGGALPGERMELPSPGQGSVLCRRADLLERMRRDQNSE